MKLPVTKRGCFAGYYFIAHSRKKVILLPELPLQIRDRLDRAQPVCIGRPVARSGRSQSGRAGFLILRFSAVGLSFKQPFTNYGHLSQNGERKRV